MEGIIRFLEDHYAPIAIKVGEQRHLRAIRDGIVTLIPLLLIGSLFLVIAFPPIQSLAKMVEPYIGNLLTVTNVTLGLMAMLASFSIAYSLAGSYKMDPLASGMFSVAAFMLATPFTKDGNINMGWMGSRGLFVAMLCAIIVVEIQHFMIRRNIVIKMPDGVPPTVARSFMSLIPGTLTLTLIWAVNMFLLGMGTNMQDLIFKALATPLLNLGGSLPAFLIAVLVAQLLWSVGIHGSAIVSGVMSPIWLSFAQQNAAAKAAGEAVPNVICGQFWDMFATIGGAGATFPLAIMLLTVVKSKQLKAIGKSAIWPGIFNINEPIVFGMPIVMNPVLMIPFIFAPLVSVVIGYVGMSSGFVEKAFAMAPWTTPPVINTFINTGDIKASLLQLICILAVAVIYYPFLKMWDNAKLKEEAELEKVSA